MAVRVRLWELYEHIAIVDTRSCLMLLVLIRCCSVSVLASVFDVVTG